MIQQNNIEVVDMSMVKLVNYNTGQYRKKFQGVEKEGCKTCSKCMKSKLLDNYNVGRGSKWQ